MSSHCCKLTDTSLRLARDRGIYVIECHDDDDDNRSVLRLHIV